MEEFSYNVASTWKLGQKGKNNGVLFLVVRDDRKVRIEVGSGLEGDLPDVTCGRIIRNEIVPRFKEGDYDKGIRDGVRAIIQAIGGSYVASDETESTGEFWPIVMASGIFFLVVGIFTIIAVGSQGSSSWFLFAFLIPFWLAFPLALYGVKAGLTLFGTYVIGFLSSKVWFATTAKGKFLAKKWNAKGFGGSGAFSSGGWSSGGGGSSSSSFSAGGGSFSGGGSSGSW